MNSSVGSCRYPPGSSHQSKILKQAQELKKKGTPESSAKNIIEEDWAGYHKNVSAAAKRGVEAIYSERLGAKNERNTWGKEDPDLTKKIVSQKPLSLEQLKDKSPHPCMELPRLTRRQLLTKLYPPDSLLCMGSSPDSFETNYLLNFSDSDKAYPFIVPRTMKEKYGRTQAGKLSQRTNNNIGPERYIVVEFDDHDELTQVSLINFLGDFMPLCAVCHSGNKSLHSWFNGHAASEERVFGFRKLAARVGADTNVFTASQMVRMPNETRQDNGKQQTLYYLSESNLPPVDGSIDKINFDKYPRAPELVASKSNTIKVPTIESLSEFKANCSPKPYELLEGTIYKGCKVALAGQSKAGKSHLAMQLAHAISTGNDFLGMSTRKSKVLYLNLELPDFVVNRRYAALESKISDNSDNPNLYISNGRGNWSGIESLDMMVDEIIEKGIGLIVVDPFYKVHDIDEIDQASVKKVLRSFDEITDKTDATLVYIHHFNKGKASDKHNIDLLAGSGVLARDFDSFMLLKENKDGKPVLEFILRCHPPKEPIILGEDYPIKVVDNESMSEGGGTLPSESEKVTNGKYCFEQIKPVLANNEPIASGELQKKVEDETGMKKSTFNALLKEAKECGLVKSQRTGKEILYELPEDEHVQTI
jgi:hypothetical protein